MEQRAQGRAVIRSSVCLTILGPRSQSRGHDSRSQSRGHVSHRFCLCQCRPCFWDLRSHTWFRVRTLCTKNPSRSKQQDGFRPRNALTPMAGLNSLPVMSSSPKVKTGVVFSGKTERACTASGRKEPGAPWSRILRTDCHRGDGPGIVCRVRDREGIPGSPLLSIVFASYEVPLPAFTMPQLLVQDLATVDVQAGYCTSKDIIGSFRQFCHCTFSTCHSVGSAHRAHWAPQLLPPRWLPVTGNVKLIDFDAAEELQGVLAEFVQVQFWDWFSFFKHETWFKKGMKQRIQKAKRRPKHEHPLRNFEMYFSWSIESLQRTMQRWVLQLLAYAPTSTDVFGDVQCMEDVEDGRPRYLRSRENIPSYCVHERRSGIDRWIQRTSLNSSVNAGPRRFPEHPRAAFASQPGLAAGWVGAFWPTMDEEPYQFPKKPHKSQVHRTTQITHITSIWAHQAIPILHWWDDTAHHCCSVNLLGTTVWRTLHSFHPTLRYMLHTCKDMAEGHTWANHGYDTACMVNQMTVSSWIDI